MLFENIKMNASCRFCNEHSKPTHAFAKKTAPTYRRQGDEHWLVAYRKTVEINSKNVYKRVKRKQQECEVSGVRTLNKELLLQIHCAEEPFELSSVNIVEQHFNAAISEDFIYFNNVFYIDASINVLSLDHFRTFVSLRELSLCVNNLQDMTFDPANFPHLEVLDLSYNSLSGDAITAIGLLSRLRVLHLTDNQLYHLPPSLQLSNRGPTQPTSEDETLFKCLEVLMLDDNKLSSDVFSCLANLKRLKYLNLRGNAITEVPLLVLLDHLKTMQTSTEHSEADRQTHENMKDNLLKLMQFIQLKDWEEYKEASFPFPELQFLNLSGNKIAEEEALLAVALFPMLNEIDISSNPLTTQRSGDPPLLTYYLQDKLGVKIKRKKEQEIKTLSQVSALPKWKARKAIPVSKNTEKWNDPTHGEVKETVAQVSSDESSEHQPVLPFFVTETEEDCESEMKTSKWSRENPESTSHKSVTELTLVEPIGIQTAVRMLDHTLKTLNVYRDSKPKLDSIQTPYREKEKRIKALPPPPSPLLQQQSEQFNRMIEEMKVNKTMREVPLTKVINGANGNKQDYKEAVSLLNDMKAKYKMVHRKTMDQEASLWSGQDSEQPQSSD